MHCMPACQLAGSKGTYGPGTGCTPTASFTPQVCLLEATSVRSRALYERHGFICYEEFRVRPSAPPVFFMLREPIASSASTALGRQPSLAAAAAVLATAAAVAHPAAEMGSKPGKFDAVAAAWADTALACDSIAAVRSVRAQEVEELLSARLPCMSSQADPDGQTSMQHAEQHRPHYAERAYSDESSEDSVVMAHSAMPVPSAALVHAMSLKQAAATAWALAAAAHSCGVDTGP